VDLVLEIAHDALPVFDRFPRSQRLVEEGREIVVLPAGNDRGDDLIEIEVAETCGRPGSLGRALVIWR
jgi:hypothetical protein